VLKRLYRTRRLSLTAVLAAAALAGALGLGLIASEWVQALWVATTLLGTVGLALFSAASRRIPKLLLESMRERNLRATVATVAGGILPAQVQAHARPAGERALPALGPPVADPRLWQPAPLPRPSEPALGELEAATLAGVVELPPAESAAPAFDVLDALRRRRAAG
jgi:type IV secretory pathway TrbD component